MIRVKWVSSFIVCIIEQLTSTDNDHYNTCMFNVQLELKTQFIGFHRICHDFATQLGSARNL